MAPPKPVRETTRYFTVEDANRRLPLVSRIVSDIVDQWAKVNELEQRLSGVARNDSRKSKPAAEPTADPYGEEVAASRAELDSERAKLEGYIGELERLGVELKGQDGLCDFPSLRDGREVYLCWRLGEPEVAHWHELTAGVAGRQPLEPRKLPASAGTGESSR